MLGGAICMLVAQEPDIIIGEEGKLVAIRTEANNLAINRASGSKFTLNNWQQGYGTNDVLGPLTGSVGLEEAQFACADKLCIARERGGLIVAYTDDPAQKSSACAEGDIVVLAFAGAAAYCTEKDTLVITKRDLAVRGGVEIRLHASRRELFPHLSGASPNTSFQGRIAKANAEHMQRLVSATITYAVGQPDRPWNSYRIYSRTARNLDGDDLRRRRDASSG